jgi:membrane protein
MRGKPVLDRPQKTPLWALVGGLLLMRTNGRAHPIAAKRATSNDPPNDRSGAPAMAHSTKGPAREEGRGRAANSPTEIPARGWKDIAFRIFHGISEDRIVSISAAVTFFALLAMFPGIASLISLYGLFTDPASISQHLNIASGILPEGGMSILSEQVKTLTSQPPKKLGFAMLAGLAIALWSANGGIKAMFDALNVVYREDERRSFFRLNATSLAFTIGVISFMLIAIVAITILPLALDYIGLTGSGNLILTLARWPALLVVVIFAIALIYRYGPSRDEAKWRWISPGSILAAIAWIAASLLFSWYAANFGSYNKTYGSLGAVIGFMTWLWISSIVILVGAKLNAEMEHQTARDTTEGQPQCRGNRDAHAADTVGRAYPP